MRQRRRLVTEVRVTVWVRVRVVPGMLLLLLLLLVQVGIPSRCSRRLASTSNADAADLGTQPGLAVLRPGQVVILLLRLLGLLLVGVARLGRLLALSPLLPVAHARLLMLRLARTRPGVSAVPLLTSGARRRGLLRLLVSIVGRRVQELWGRAHAPGIVPGCRRWRRLVAVELQRRDSELGRLDAKSPVVMLLLVEALRRDAQAAVRKQGLLGGGKLGVRVRGGGCEGVRRDAEATVQRRDLRSDTEATDLLLLLLRAFQLLLLLLLRLRSDAETAPREALVANLLLLRRLLLLRLRLESDSRLLLGGKLLVDEHTGPPGGRERLRLHDATGLLTRLRQVRRVRRDQD